MVLDYWGKKWYFSCTVVTNLSISYKSIIKAQSCEKNKKNQTKMTKKNPTA